MLQNVKPNWDESDSSLDSYIRNKPVIPVQKQADWDESDSSDPSYILGNPTKEVNKGLDIKGTYTNGNTTTTISQLTVPASVSGGHSFGTIQGNMLVQGSNTTIYGSNAGTIELTASNGINIIPRYSYMGVRYNGNSPNTAGGFAIVDSYTGQLPANIIPSGGNDYDTISNGVLQKGGKYLIDSSAVYASPSGFDFSFSNAGEEVEFHINGWDIIGTNDQPYIQIGNWKFGSFFSSKPFPCGLYKYFAKYGYDYSTVYLLNEHKQIIATNYGLSRTSQYICNGYMESSSLTDNCIPLSSEYMLMPFGGYATPISTGYAGFGIEFGSSASGTVDFYSGSEQLYTRYLQINSINPVWRIYGCTIQNFDYLCTVNDRITITVIGSSSSHLYRGSSTNDLMSNADTTDDSMKMVRIITWCEWVSSANTWRRYFFKEGSASTWHHDTATLPAQPTN